MFVNVRDGKLFYQDVGRGDPVVLIPGLGMTHQYFRALTEALQPHFRVLAVDVHGIGQSDSSLTEYSVEGWADDIAAVLQHAGVPSAHLVGSSLGGCVAQMFALRHPGKTLSLVVMASISEIQPMLELNYRVRIDLIRATGMSELFARFAIASLYGRTFYATARGQAAAVANNELIRGNKQETYISHLEAVLRFGRCGPGQDRADTVTRRLRDVHQPALVMVGLEDVLTVPMYSELMAEALPNVHLIKQPECGHLNLLEQPDVTCSAVLEFLTGIPR